MSDHQFRHVAVGMSRQPPVVESVLLEFAERRANHCWLTVTQGGVQQRVPLNADDCRHLSTLLAAAAQDLLPWAPPPTFEERVVAAVLEAQRRGALR